MRYKTGPYLEHVRDFALYSPLETHGRDFASWLRGIGDTTVDLERYLANACPENECVLDAGHAAPHDDMAGRTWLTEIRPYCDEERCIVAQGHGGAHMDVNGRIYY